MELDRSIFSNQLDINGFNDPNDFPGPFFFSDQNPASNLDQPLSLNLNPVAVLVQQFKEVQTNKDGFTVHLFKDNIFMWNITFFGPENSPYEGGTFPALMTFPEDYPLHPPSVRFLCPMYHPNVTDPYCDVCLPILQLPDEITPGLQEFGTEADGYWNPAFHAEAVIFSIIHMFSEPNLDLYDNYDAAMTWETDKRDFLRKVRRIMLE